MYVCKSVFPRMHAHSRTCTPARKTHPSHMLTSLLPQNGKTPLDLANNDEVKTAFAEHAAKGGQAEQPSE